MAEEIKIDKEVEFAKKKIKVMADVEGILKTGHNKSQDYNYAEESEVVKHIRKAFISNNLTYSIECGKPEISHVIPTRSGEMKHLIVPLVCTLTDSETGYSKSYPWYGGAADGGDKALYKAFTSGSKYFLMKTFLLPTGDDVEAFNDVDAPGKGKDKKPPPKPKLPLPEKDRKKLLETALAAYRIDNQKEVTDGFEISKEQWWKQVLIFGEPQAPKDIKVLNNKIKLIDTLVEISK